MHLHVSVTWHLEYRPVGWSLGYCPSCQQQGAARLENVVRVFYLWDVIRLCRTLVGKGARCDFCRRRLDNVREEQGINFDQWSPRDGLASLLSQLGILEPLCATNPAPDIRLHSLLTAVERASSAHRFALTPIGIVLGAVLGVLGAIPLGTCLYENQKVQVRLDELGFVMATWFVGLWLGVVLGATVEFLLRRDRSAFARVQETYANYRIDLDRLEELSEGYSRRIRKAVKAVRTKVGLDPDR